MELLKRQRTTSWKFIFFINSDNIERYVAHRFWLLVKYNHVDGKHQFQCYLSGQTSIQCGS